VINRALVFSITLVASWAFAVYAAAITSNYSPEQVLYCWYHGLLYVVLQDQLFFSQEIKNNPAAFYCSPSWIFVLIHTAYFGSTICGYLDKEPFYPELSASAQSVLAANTGVALALLALLKCIVKLRVRSETSLFLGAKAPWALVYTIILIYALLELVLYARGYRSVYTGTGYSIVEVRDYLDYLALFLKENLLVISAFLVGINLRTGLKIRSGWAVLNSIVAAFVLLISVVQLSAGRASLLAVIVFILVPQAFLDTERHRALAALLFGVAVLTLPFVSTISLGLLKRDSFGHGVKEGIQEANYRLNLASLALRVLEARPMAYDLGTVYDGALNSIPRGVFGSKDSYLTGSYEGLIVEAGLTPQRDYPDTLFSAGAMLGGVFGFFLIPIAFGLLLNRLEKFSESGQKRTWKECALLLMILVFARNIELGWAEIFLHLRHVVMILVFTVPISIIMMHKLPNSRAGRITL
jgi:hypothetical protein